MYAVTTPHDKRLAQLNAKLSATLLAAGSHSDRRRAAARLMANRTLGTTAQAESATYRARTGRLDSKDLLTQLARGRKLDSFKANELPPAVAAKPKPARAAYVAGVRRRRAALRAEIAKLAKSRDAYLARKRKSRRGPTSFDDTIGSALKVQGGRAGLSY